MLEELIQLLEINDLYYELNHKDQVNEEKL